MVPERGEPSRIFDFTDDSILLGLWSHFRHFLPDEPLAMAVVGTFD
jgi:hypothetical protein